MRSKCAYSRPDWARFEPGVEIPEATTAAGAFLLKLSPEAATAALASILGSIPLGVAAAKKWKETRKLRNLIWEREHAMTELQEKYGRVRMLEESLQHSMESLTSLADKIDAISGIWHLLFMQKLSITRGVYRNLVDTLEEYVRETAVLDGEKDHPDVFGLCNVDSDVE
ncbi:hypothetical protein ONZ51_g12338 [Trametes cubensis]|uniref:Uncharacterized protein n=1 Tax=Trametes cubensis TaxID=1111947 RepID=A0AAD7TFW9_9APHY|nr:hypothetical protein ONZ51_g12338 [Trametes cubensis]